MIEDTEIQMSVYRKKYIAASRAIEAANSLLYYMRHYDYCTPAIIPSAHCSCGMDGAIEEFERLKREA